MLFESYTNNGREAKNEIFLNKANDASRAPYIFKIYVDCQTASVDTEQYLLELFAHLILELRDRE